MRTMLKVLTHRFPSYLRNYAAIRTLSKCVYPGSKLQLMEKRRKFRYHLFLHYPYYQALTSLFSHERLSGITQATPKVYDKVHRPYVIRGAKAAQRFHIVKSNYQFVSHAFSSRLTRSIFIDKDFQLCRLPLPEKHGELTVSLRYDTKFEREGEMTLGLCDQSGKYLYSISFSFHTSDGQSEALIGCIQGGTRLSEMKELTKAMEGLRPQNLVIFLLRTFCRHFGVDRLLAVGFESQVYCETYKRPHMRFDYDAFWQELGGVPTGDGLFAMPLEHQRKPLSEIRSNKRASYTRRYALLDELEEQIGRRLQEYSREAAHAEPDHHLSLAHPAAAASSGLPETAPFGEPCLQA